MQLNAKQNNKYSYAAIALLYINTTCKTMLILLAMAAAQESSNLKIQPEICDLLAEINTEYSKLPPINSNLLQDPRNYQLNIIDQNNYFIGNMVNFSDISCNVLTTNLSVKGQKTLYNDNVNTLKVIKSSLTKCCKELDDKYNTDLTSYAEDVSQATSPV
ncbi:hypothetical protein C0J52_03659 [Blattella germanica]|nr:hypothetical protein C0J52_03659 [Blattella germanica]